MKLTTAQMVEALWERSQVEARHWKAIDGGSAEYTQIGWYGNTFGCIDGERKITRLLHTYQWVSGNGALFDFSDPELIAVMAQVFAPENRVAA